MSGEQHDNDSGHMPGNQVAGRIGGPPPSRRGGLRHGATTSATDATPDAVAAAKPHPPAAMATDEHHTSEQSRFQTRVFEPGALTGVLGNSATTGDLAENQQKPVRFQTMAFEADELPREWQDLRVLHRSGSASEASVPPPAPPRSGTQVMGAATTSAPTTPPPAAGPGSLATGSVANVETVPGPPPSIPSEAYENRRISTVSKPHTQLFKPGELPTGIGFEAEDSMNDPARSSNVIYGGQPGGTATFDVQPPPAEEVPRYPTVSIDRTQMLSPVSDSMSPKMSIPVGPEPAWVTHGSKPGIPAGENRPAPDLKPNAPVATNPAAVGSLRVAKRALHSDIPDEGRLEPVFVMTPEENDPTSMVPAPPPDDPAFHRAATVVREPSAAKPMAPTAFSERETMLNIPAVRLPAEASGPSMAAGGGMPAAQPTSPLAGTAGKVAWANENINPVVEREKQRHSAGRSMFAPQPKTNEVATPSSSWVLDLRFYGVVSLLLAITSLAIPTMAGEQLIAPWAGVIELAGPAFTAALFGLLTLAWVAIPMPVGVRSGLLMMTGMGCLVLGSMNIQDSALRLVFLGHPAIDSIFATSVVATILFWAALVLYPAGLFAHKFVSRSRLPLVTTLTGVVVIAATMLILGALTAHDSPASAMLTLLQNESGTRGDRLASILLLSAAVLSLIGLVSFIGPRFAALSTIWGGLFITTCMAALFAIATHVSQHIGGALEPVKLAFIVASGVVLTIAGLGGTLASVASRRS